MTSSAYLSNNTVPCRTEVEALKMREVMAARLQNSGLELNPEKTKTSVAKTIIGEGPTRTRSLIFLATRFGQGDRRIVEDSTSSVSVQRLLQVRTALVPAQSLLLPVFFFA
jgi:hypothetical protein